MFGMTRNRSLKVVSFVRQVTIEKSFDGLSSFPASSLSPPLLPPPCLLSNVQRSQDTRCDRSAVAPASCSLWPCCERGVTSCLSLCLFLALPEGPCGTGRGCDGSTADPRGYGPPGPGPGPGCLPASAASADGHRRGPRSSCRVPGLFSLPSFLPFTAHTPPSRVQALSQLPAGWLCHKLSPGPTASPPHTAGHAPGVSHMPTHVRTRTFTSAYQPKDMQTQT